MFLSMLRNHPDSMYGRAVRRRRNRDVTEETSLLDRIMYLLLCTFPLMEIFNNMSSSLLP